MDGRTAAAADFVNTDGGFFSKRVCDPVLLLTMAAGLRE